MVVGGGGGGGESKFPLPCLQHQVCRLLFMSVVVAVYEVDNCELEKCSGFDLIGSQNH